jgi:hypothetical protein
VLWPAHDHHRDIRAGLPAQGLPYSHFHSDQDRYLTMPAPRRNFGAYRSR